MSVKKSYEYHNNILSIPASLLYEDWGIMAYRTYLSYCQRGKLVRIREGKGQDNYALISYHDLPESIKSICKEKLGHYEDAVVINLLEDYILPDVKAADFFARHTTPNGDTLKMSEQIKRATNCMILNAIRYILEDKKATARVFGKQKSLIWQNISKAVNALDWHKWQHNLPKNYQSLQRKYRHYTQEGYGIFIHANEGNKHTAKVFSKEQTALMRQLIAHPNNLNDEAVASFYNMTARASEWKEISSSVVAEFRKKEALYTLAGRRGTKEFLNTKSMQHKRKAPSLPMLYWVVDGWDAELVYQKKVVNAKGHEVSTYHNSLNAVMVLDPFSKYIVGYAIDDNESPDLIRRALRNALRHTEELFGTMYKPHQLQTDNYQRKKLFSIYEAATRTFTPAKVGNAKSKVIEPFFGWFNTEYFQNRLLPNWSGHNITSKKENQPNSEHLNAIRHTFPDREGCIMQIENAIAIDRAKKREAYIQAFQNLPAEDRLEFRLNEYLRHYGETTGYTNRMMAQGLTPTLLGQELSYDSFDLDFRLHTHNDWCVFYDPANLTKILAVNAKADKNSRLKEVIGTQEFILEQKHIGAMAIYDQTEADREARRRIDNYNKELHQKVRDRNIEDQEVLSAFFSGHQNKELDILKKHLIVDSKGQHKDRVSQKRLEYEDAKVEPIQQEDEEYEIIEDIRDLY